MKDGRLRIIVDANEKRPLVFDSFRVRVIKKRLPVGDYSLPGCERLITIERKDPTDLVRSLFHTYQNFHRRLAEMGEYARACILVEADYSDVLAGRYYGRIHPDKVTAEIARIYATYNVPVLFYSNRQQAALFVEKFLRRFVAVRNPGIWSGTVDVACGSLLDGGREMQQAKRKQNPNSWTSVERLEAQYRMFGWHLPEKERAAWQAAVVRQADQHPDTSKTD